MPSETEIQKDKDTIFSQFCHFARLAFLFQKMKYASHSFNLAPNLKIDIISYGVSKWSCKTSGVDFKGKRAN